MQEIWKDIKGYEGRYQISNLGRVKSLLVWNLNKKEMSKREKILKATDNGRGYYIISFWENKKRKNYYIHRLVAEAFIPNPNNEKEINHKDENKKNNVVDNLEWCNRFYNVNYSKYKKPLLKSAKTNTGERYIIFRKEKNEYRVIIRKKEYGISKTLEEAIRKRNQILKEVGLDGIFNLTNK